MNLENLKTAVTSNAARQLLFARKHSPRILFVGGTVGVVTAAVLACRATLKLQDVLDNADRHVDYIREEAGTEQITHEYAEEQIRKAKIRAGLDIAKLYLPAVGLGVASVAALTGSHVVLDKRNAGLMAAYAALDRGFKEYRQRVSEEFGEDVDRKFRLGAEPVVVEEKLADGKTKTTTTDQVKKDGKYIGGSPYAAAFDERSRYFSKEPGANQMFLDLKQNHANDKLRSQGYLFLNEVYKMLGLPTTKAGHHVGWVYRNDSEPKTGDNYVSFGVFDGDTEWVEAFIDGHEKYAVLDFNVDGVILDLAFDN